MSNTYKHKSQAKFKQKLIDYKEVLQSTKDMWDRDNNELGEFRAAKKDLKEKIIDKETFNIVYKEADELTEQQWREEYLNKIP